MKIKSKKIEEFNEFLDRITPRGGEIESTTVCEGFSSDDEPIRLEFKRLKPEESHSQSSDDEEKAEAEESNDDLQIQIEEQKDPSEAMTVLSEALLDKLEKLIPADAKKMTSETTLTMGRVAIDFNFRMERTKPKEEAAHKRTHDVSANEEREGKKRKLEK